jgi:hypothetical protein
MNAQQDKEDMLILDIDFGCIDEEALLPDEDFIIGGLSQSNGGLMMKEENMFQHVRDNLENWKDNWGDSLEYLGSVAHLGVIPANCIKRYARLKDSVFWILNFDQSTSLIAYKIMSEHYRQKIMWLFGDTDESPQTSANLLYPDLTNQMQEQRDLLVEVVECGVTT